MNARFGVTGMLIFLMAAHAQAGLAVILVPSTPQPAAGYLPGETLQIDVMAQLDANGPSSIRVRDLQFDFSQTDPRLAPSLVLTHPDTKTQGDIYFWDYSSAPYCQSDPTLCGNAHFIDDELESDQILRDTYAALTEDFDSIRLVQSVPRRIGVLEISVPYFEYQDSAILDLLNETDPDPLHGARLTYLPVPPTAFGHWSAHEGTITGGKLGLTVIPEPGAFMLLAMAIGTLLPKRESS